MALIVCPYCGPESLCYSGRIVMRVCESCKVAEFGLRQVEPPPSRYKGLLLLVEKP